MESQQRLIIVMVKRLQELESDLDRIHQEQATLVNELVQLTSAVADYTLSTPTNKCVDSQVTSNIGHMEEDIASTATKSRPPHIQLTTTPVKNTQTQQQLQVGDHIYIKNKISHSDLTEICPSQRVGHFKVPC